MELDIRGLGIDFCDVYGGWRKSSWQSKGYNFECRCKLISRTTDRRNGDSILEIEVSRMKGVKEDILIGDEEHLL